MREVCPFCHCLPSTLYPAGGGVVVTCTNEACLVELRVWGPTSNATNRKWNKAMRALKEKRHENG